MIGRAEPNFLREGKAENRARLAVIGQPVSRRAVDQAVEIGDTPKRLAGDREGEAVIGRRQLAFGARSRLQSLSAPKNAIKHLQRGLPRAETLNGWHWTDQRSS